LKLVNNFNGNLFLALFIYSFVLLYYESSAQFANGFNHFTRSLREACLLQKQEEKQASNENERVLWAFFETAEILEFLSLVSITLRAHSHFHHSPWEEEEEEDASQFWHSC
jgi:hypothetical protein